MRIKRVACLFALFFAPAYSLQAGITPISFEKSMRSSAHFSPSFAKNDPHFLSASKLYNRYIHTANLVSHSIPRYIHIIQLGGWPPGYIEETIQTWKKFHPGWEIMVWMDRDVPLFQLKNKALFDTNPDPAMRAALWSYEILDRFGGIYVNVNCECLQSLDPIRKNCTFFAGLGHEKQATISNHIIGSTADHPVMKACIAAIGANPQDLNVGRELLTRCFFAALPSLSLKPVLFPVTYFSPMPQGKMKPRTKLAHIKDKWAKEESFTIDYGPGRRPLTRRPQRAKIASAN